MKIKMKLVYLCTVALALAGCRSATGPGTVALPVPEVAALTACFHGHPLTGPIPAKEGAKPLAAPLESTVYFLALSELPEEALEPASLHTQWTTAFEGGSSMSHLPSFTAGARVGTFETVPSFFDILDQGEWGCFAPVARMRAVLGADETRKFRLEETGSRFLPEDAMRRSAEIQIHYEATQARSLQVALVIENWADPQVEAVEEEPLPGGADPIALKHDPKAVRSAFLQREMMLLDPETSNALWPLALVFRSPFDSSPAEALVAVIELAPGPEGDGELSARLTESERKPEAPGKTPWPETRFQWPVAVRQYEEGAVPGTSESFSMKYDFPAPDEPVTPGPVHVLDDLPHTSKKRSALLYLASRCGAPLTIDTVLVAPETLIFDLVNLVCNRASGTKTETLAALGWIIETSTYSVLADRLAAQSLGWELEALLARHTGEVGRDAVTLKETVLQVQDRETLEQRLVHENMLYLEDSSPSARCRAFDWLSEKGRAPDRYDPLDPIKKRRAALQELFLEP